MSETSDMKFLNTCQRLLDVFSGEPKWNPSNAALETGSLKPQLATGLPIAQDVWAKNAAQEIKINDRQASYDKIDPRVRATRRYLKSCGATAAEVADANTIMKKILGERSKSKVKVNPNKSAAEAEKTISTSHQSYDSRLGNLKALREMLANITAYQPNENDIKLTAYTALADECQTKNNAISQGNVVLLAALNLRDAKLYDDPDSILETFRDGKEYYKSLFVPSSPQFKAITAKDMALDSNSRS